VIPRIVAFFTAILWDEAASQRYMGAFLFFLGKTLASGGVVPTSAALLGHPLTLSFLARWYGYGDGLQLVAFFVLGGSALPAPLQAARRAGNGNGNGGH